MPVENYICLIAQDLKSFINLVDQYIRVLYIKNYSFMYRRFTAKILINIRYLIA